MASERLLRRVPDFVGDKPRDARSNDLATTGAFGASPVLQFPSVNGIGYKVPDSPRPPYAWGNFPSDSTPVFLVCGGFADGVYFFGVARPPPLIDRKFV